MGIEVRSHRRQIKPKKDFEIKMVQLNDLVPHEETIETELEWFIKEVQEIGLLYWPMLIAKDSNLILDGHHRTAGLLRLNYQNAPAIIIDYMDNDLIKLDTWYPLIRKPVVEIITKLKGAGLQLDRIDNADYDLDLIRSRTETAYIGNLKELYIFHGEREKIFKIILDEWIENMTYFDNPDLCFETSNENGTAVVSWAYTKKEILNQVNKGLIHLPKTTRHDLKYQVAKCNYPLVELYKND